MCVLDIFLFFKATQQQPHNIMSSKEIAHVNKMVPFQANMLNDPIVVSSSAGLITDINPQFTLVFGWEREEIVGQNCHLLIPSKFVRKSAHDRKLHSYSFGRDSPIIGKNRIVPVSTPDDKEVLTTIKIIPIKSKKEFCFVSLFNKIDFDHRFFDFSSDYKIVRNKIKKLSKTEDFREESVESSIIVKDISRLFFKEFEVIGDFIAESHLARTVINMAKHFLIGSPIGNLEYLRKDMERIFDNDNASYLNICCLRVIFPSIESRVSSSFLNNLKASLYDGNDESSTGTATL